MNSIFSRILLLLAGIILFASCDKGVNDIGASVLGDDNFEFESYTGASVVAFTQKTDVVQTNNNSIDQIGFYDNPVFGKTAASFASQLQLETLNPVIINESDVDITLDIPFLEPTATETSVANSFTYELNNIVGDKSSLIKLSVYRVSREFNKIDSDRNGQQQFYYSNDFVESRIIGNRLNDGLATNNDEIVLDKSEKSITTNAFVTTNGVKTFVTETKKIPPTIRLKLNQSLLNDLKSTLASNLASQDNFSQFFRGIYIKAEQSGSSQGYIALLNFNEAKIRISYKGATSSTVSTVIQQPDIVLGFGSTSNSLISINVLQQINKSDYSNALSNPNKIIGDEKLYLKGGNGSVAMIDLFGKDLNDSDGITPLSFINKAGILVNGNGIADELDIIRKEKWLINEANLVFHLDPQTYNLLSDSKNDKPLRIALYNSKTNLPIIDFTNDIGSYKEIFDGILDKTKKTYKIRVTNFINNLIKNGEEDIRLGLYVSNSLLNTNLVSASESYNSLSYAGFQLLGVQEQNAYFFPNNSIINPLGIVLFGNSNAVPLDKRLKLEIFYTKAK